MYVALGDSISIDAYAGGAGRGGARLLARNRFVWLSRNRVVDRAFAAGDRAVAARFTRFDVYDYTALLHLRGQWRVAQLPVAEDDWIASRPLGQLRLPEEGVAVLGVERADGAWVGAPYLDVHVCPGDVVVLYGRASMLDDVACRVQGSAGDEASEPFRTWHAASPPEEPAPYATTKGRRSGGR